MSEVDTQVQLEQEGVLFTTVNRLYNWGTPLLGLADAVWSGLLRD